MSIFSKIKALTPDELKEQMNQLMKETKHEVKIIGFHLDKGGPGKTTHAFNFSGFCANVLNKRVLFIDGDRSCNATATFGVNGTKTIADIFTTGEFEIYKTDFPNIDMIPGSSLFTDEGINIATASSKYMEFVIWVFNNKEYLDENYDFIVIDTHNDTSRVTFNLISACHLIVSPATPDGDSFKAIYELNDFIENEIKPMTIPFGQKESVVDLDIAILPNRITFNGNNLPHETREFVEEVEQMDNYIGLIPEKQQMRESRLLGEDIFTHYNKMKSSLKKNELTPYVKNVEEIYSKLVLIACNKAKESK